MIRIVDARGAAAELDVAEQAGPSLRGLDAPAVFGRLERRYGDLGVAMHWFVGHGRTEEALRLGTALVPLWMATKRLEEGSAWLDRALALPGGDDSHRGRGLFDAGYLAFWQGQDDRATALTNRALEIGRRIGNPTVMAIALAHLARIALRTDAEEARRLCLNALAVTDGTDDRIGRSHALHVIGVASQMAGDLVGARRYMTERIEQAREVGDFATVSSEAGNLSMVERQLGNLERAEALVREALDIDDQRGDELAIPWKINGLAAVTAERGEPERAAVLVGAADALLGAQGAAWPPDELVQYDGTVARLTSAMGPAAFGRSRSVGRAMSSREAVDFALGPRSTA
jgi:non-specific serine/threonine protein kinase